MKYAIKLTLQLICSSFLVCVNEANKLYNMMMIVTTGGGSDGDSYVPSHLKLCICLCFGGHVLT